MLLYLKYKDTDDLVKCCIVKKNGTKRVINSFSLIHSNFLPTPNQLLIILKLYWGWYEACMDLVRV